MRRINLINIFKRCAWHSLLRYRKNRERSTRQTDYMLGNVKKFGFSLWKWGWEAMWLCFKKPHFSLKTFFSRALRKFSIHRMIMFNICKRCAQHSLLRYRNNRERSTRQTEYMLGNARKIWVFTLKMRLRSYGAMLQKTPFFTPNFFFAGS